MKKIHTTKLWAGALTAGATAALGLTLVTSSAPAEGEKQRGGATIQMVQNGNQLSFEGPDTVVRGQTLRIANTTNSNQVGPHTFSLTKQNLIPSNGAEFRACFKNKPESVCHKIYKAHEVDFRTGKVGRKVVDLSKEGWNIRFRDQGEGKGDSWVALKENADYEAVVSARAGKILPYFCAVHPEMQGSIEVLAPTR